LIIKIEEIVSYSTNKANYGQKIIKKLLHLKCDTCDIIFKKNDKKRDRERNYHFCNKQHAQVAYRKGGIIYNAIKGTNMILYNNPNYNNIKQAQITCEAKYGKGIKNPFQAKEVKEKSKQTMIKNYGVEHPMYSKKIKARINFQEIVCKAHKTKKRNGSYKQQRSRVECELEKYLLQYFNIVDTSVIINNWIVDFFIQDIKVYLELDGEYWHGLDRSLKEIKNSNTQHDRIIYENYLRDRKKDKWFKENNLKLIRLTDKEFLHAIKINNIKELIISRLKND